MRQQQHIQQILRQTGTTPHLIQQQRQQITEALQNFRETSN